MNNSVKSFAARLLWAGILAIPGVISWAQDGRFTATAPGAVNAGEVFEITFSIPGQPSGFKPPSFSPFAVVAGPSTGFSSYSVFSNGKLQQNVTSTYTYSLQAGNPGTYKIAGATATLDGKTISSNELNIEVVKDPGSGRSNAGSPNNNGTNNPQADPDEVVATGEDLYAAFLLDQKTVWQGQGLVATLKIYDRMGLAQLDPPKLPNFKNFYKLDLKTPQLRQLVRENVGGKIYNTGVVARFLLYPQVTGDLTLDKVEFDGVVERTVTRKSRSWWDFDLPSVQQQQVKISSRPLVIHVKPLPPGAPASFNGAVGSFRMTVLPDKTKLKTNEAITVRVTVSGTGNLSLIQPPGLDFPPDFESYKPKTTLNDKVSIDGDQGNVSFEYVTIARHPGDFTLPAVHFAYFDPTSGSFKELSSSEIKLHVEQGDNDSTMTIVSGVSQEDVKFIGKDIRFIKTEEAHLQLKNYWLINQFWYWLVYGMATIVFAVLVILRRRMIRERSNQLLLRNRKANRLAQKRLRKARNFMKQGNRESFYEEIHRAASDYLSDKLLIPLADLSKDHIREKLAGKGIGDNLINRLNSLLDACEMARYAPVSSVPPMNEMFSDMAEIISELDQNI